MRGRFLGLVSFALLVGFFAMLLPFAWMLLKALLWLIPLWLFLALFGRVTRGSYFYYQPAAPVLIHFTNTSVHFPNTFPENPEKCLCHFPEVCVVVRTRYVNRLSFVIVPAYPPAGRRCP